MRGPADADNASMFTEVVLEGELFRRPAARYPEADPTKLIVVCDRCRRRDIQVFMGHGDVDLCMRCVDEVSALVPAAAAPEAAPAAAKTADDGRTMVTLMCPKMYAKPPAGPPAEPVGGYGKGAAGFDDVWGQPRRRPPSPPKMPKMPPPRIGGGLSRMMCWDFPVDVPPSPKPPPRIRPAVLKSSALPGAAAPAQDPDARTSHRTPKKESKEATTEEETNPASVFNATFMMQDMFDAE